METSNDGSMLFSVDDREYRIRGLSPVGLERLRVNVRLTIDGDFHLDTIDLYQARARSLFAQSAAKLCGVSEQQVSADLLQMIEKLEAARPTLKTLRRKREGCGGVVVGGPQGLKQMPRRT